MSLPSEAEPNGTDPMREPPADDLIDALMSDEVGELGHRTLDADLRLRLAEQQAVHGLLRSLGSLDPTAREMRIQRVLSALGSPASSTAASAASSAWHQRPGARLGIAAVVLIGGTLLVARLMPRRLPLAQAVVNRALAHLERVFDREYAGRWTLEAVAESGGEGVAIRGRTFELYVGGKGRSLVHIDMPFGVVAAGCFEGRPWLRMPGWPVRHLRSPGMFKLPDGVELDLGLLQIDTLLGMLPGEFELTTLGRLTGEPEDGPTTLRVRAERPADPARRRSQVTIDFWSEEHTGLLRKLEVVSDGPCMTSDGAAGADTARTKRRMRWSIEYVGPVELPDAAYRGEE